MPELALEESVDAPFEVLVTLLAGAGFSEVYPPFSSAAVEVGEPRACCDDALE